MSVSVPENVSFTVSLDAISHFAAVVGSYAITVVTGAVPITESTEVSDGSAGKLIMFQPGVKGISVSALCDKVNVC